jgi:hypothetical protein
MKPIRFHPEADVEVTEAVEFYEGRSSGLGSALLAELERSLGQIAIAPEGSQKVGRRARRKPLWRFPYNLIYAVYPDRIRVVAFAHQKRRPFYWRRRLKEPTAEGIGPTSA